MRFKGQKAIYEVEYEHEKGKDWLQGKKVCRVNDVGTLKGNSLMDV